MKVSVEDFEISAVGEVPGELLGHFSLDEHQGYLRIATAVGAAVMIPQHWDPIGVRVEEYDVYILDESLRVVGSV